MVAAYAGTYLIKIDIDDFNTEEMAAVGLRVEGVPTFVEIDDSGRGTRRRITSSVWGKTCR